MPRAKLTNRTGETLFGVEPGWTKVLDLTDDELGVILDDARATKAETPGVVRVVLSDAPTSGTEAAPVEAEDVAEAPKRRRPGRPKGSKNKPKVVEE